MDELTAKVSSRWKHWNYKNTFFLILSLIVFFIFAEHPLIKGSLTFIGDFGYIGAFITGILFVSVFTVAPAAVVLFYLAETLNPFLIALFAGAGGVVGDYLILHFLKDRVFAELQPLFLHRRNKPIRNLFKTPYFAWAIPIVGAIIIMSPFPDELGLGLMGISKMKTWQLMALLFFLDVIGVFMVVSAAQFFN